MDVTAEELHSALAKFNDPKRGATANLRRSFEIKVSASDLLKELRDPDKRWMAYALSNEFYFVAPKGLIDRKLLAKDDGLLELQEDGELKLTKRARCREAMPPRWEFVASIARRLESHENGVAARYKRQMDQLIEDRVTEKAGII